jgi:hypothetical protein
MSMKGDVLIKARGCGIEYLKSAKVPQGLLAKWAGLQFRGFNSR